MNDKLIGDDGMGVFIYAGKCVDDDDYVTLRIEEEIDDNKYDAIAVDLHKSELKNLINGLIDLL